MTDLIELGARQPIRRPLPPIPAPPPADHPLPPAAAAPPRCSGEWFSRREEWEPLVPAWRADHRRHAGDLGAHPDWCAAMEAAFPGSVRLARLRRRDHAVTLVPFLLLRQALDCQCGECTLLRFRPRVLWPAGSRFEQEDEAAFDALLASLMAGPVRRRFDALRFTASTNSPLWAYLSRGGWRRHGLRGYQPAPPVVHYRLRLPPSFDEYLAKFTAKTRKNRLRELRLLRQRGALDLACYRQPDQVEAFLEAAGAISRRTYQHRLLRAELNVAGLRIRLRAAAAQGWCRCYVLRCDGSACSFMLGYQYQGWYYYSAVGYDPAWRTFSVGTALQMLVLEDMYRADTPEVFDFGPGFPQMQYFGNERFEEGSYWLFRPGFYPASVLALHRSAQTAARAGRGALDRCGLRTPVLHLLRASAAADRAIPRHYAMMNWGRAVPCWS